MIDTHPIGIDARMLPAASKSERSYLFDVFLTEPSNVLLAFEIKAIEDSDI